MQRIINKTEKFSDARETIYDFGDKFLVGCPKCGSMAKVVSAGTASEKINKKLFAPHRLVCLSCPYRAEWNGGEIAIGGSVDWYFRLPLWLQISCCGQTLWAYNKKHLEYIENYVAAKIRARTPNTNKSLASRLPGWIKSVKNRDQILKAIAKLKGELNGSI